jgi:transcriptional regulator with XRE-family HTH domain
MQIGQHIRKKRLAQGATLEQIAYDAGIDASNLSRIERNRQQPSSALLKKIADALGTSVGDLYGEQAHAPGVREKVPEPYYRNRDIELLLKRYRQLTPHHQKIVLEIMKTLANQQGKT